MGRNQGRPNRLAQNGVENPVVIAFLRPVEDLVRQITQPGRKAKAEHLEQTKNQVGIAVSISVMFFDWQSILIEQSIQDIVRFSYEAVDYLDPAVLALV